MTTKKDRQSIRALSIEMYQIEDRDDWFLKVEFAPINEETTHFWGYINANSYTEEALKNGELRIYAKPIEDHGFVAARFQITNNFLQDEQEGIKNAMLSAYKVALKYGEKRVPMTMA